MHTKTTHMYVRRGLSLTALLMTLCAVTTVIGEARDSDGSRLQARAMKLSSTARDTLLPPRDRVDWRSFKVSSSGSVAISLTHKPTKKKAQIALTDARGKSLGSTTSSGGKASLKRTLKPGVYYVSVSSSAKLSYSLSVK